MAQWISSQPLRIIQMVLCQKLYEFIFSTLWSASVEELLSLEYREKWDCLHWKRVERCPFPQESSRNKIPRYSPKKREKWAQRLDNIKITSFLWVFSQWPGRKWVTRRNLPSYAFIVSVQRAQCLCYLTSHKDQKLADHHFFTNQTGYQDWIAKC